MARSSRIEGFYKLPMSERVRLVKDFGDLTDEEAKALVGGGNVDPGLADKMIENAVGTMNLPLGIAMNFLINGKDYLIPMAIEEPSVVAAASNAAKMARDKGGFWTSSTPPIMIGQVQLTGIRDPSRAKHMILERKQEVLELANRQDPMLVNLGGLYHQALALLCILGLLHHDLVNMRQPPPVPGLAIERDELASSSPVVREQAKDRLQVLDCVARHVQFIPPDSCQLVKQPPLLLRVAD